MNVSREYSNLAPNVRWVNPTTWSCDRHVPPAMIPERLSECWYMGCPSHRPPRPVPVMVLLNREELAALKDQEDLAIITKALKAYQEPEPDPIVPSAADRRQGRTKLVSCKVCVAPIWRRPTEVTPGKVFYCPVHRGKIG